MNTSNVSQVHPSYFSFTKFQAYGEENIDIKKKSVNT